jgi:hypothetical protein
MGVPVQAGRQCFIATRLTRGSADERSLLPCKCSGAEPDVRAGLAVWTNRDSVRPSTKSLTRSWSSTASPTICVTTTFTSMPQPIPRTGVSPEHRRYRFTHCVRATVTTPVKPDVWAYSLDDELTDYDIWLRSGEPEGFVWGVKWHGLYPGMRLQPESDETREWAAQLGLPFHEAVIETNAYNISLVFSNLKVSTVAPAEAPFVVPPSGPDGKFPLE